jgi:hypothetical protein
MHNMLFSKTKNILIFIFVYTDYDISCARAQASSQVVAAGGRGSNLAKAQPEEVRHPEYSSKDDIQNRLSLDADDGPNNAAASVVDHVAVVVPGDVTSAAGSGGTGSRGGGDDAAFVRANQEKIVICLTAAVSLGLVGVLVIVIGRMVRSYHHRLNGQQRHSHHTHGGGSSSLVLTSLASSTSGVGGGGLVDLDNSSLVEELELESVVSNSRRPAILQSGGGATSAASSFAFQPPQSRQPRRPSLEVEPPLPHHANLLQAALYLESRCPPPPSAAAATPAMSGSLYGTVARLPAQQRRPPKGILKNALSTTANNTSFVLQPSSPLPVSPGAASNNASLSVGSTCGDARVRGDHDPMRISSPIGGGGGNSDLPAWSAEERPAAAATQRLLLHMPPLDNLGAAVELSFRTTPQVGASEQLEDNCCDNGGSRDQLFLL